jgi:hypothetical protein
MAKGQQGPAKEDSDETFTLIIMGVFLALLVWLAYHGSLSKIAMNVRAAELWLPSIFSGSADALRVKIQNTNPQLISAGGLLMAMSESGQIMRFLFAPLIFGMAAFVYLKSPIERFRKKHSIKTLIQQEKDLWPTIYPAAKTNIPATSQTEGDWASAATEREFANKHDLIIKVKGSPLIDFAIRNGYISASPNTINTAKRSLQQSVDVRAGEAWVLANQYNMVDAAGNFNEEVMEQAFEDELAMVASGGKLNIEKATKVFVEQLGPLWVGHKTLKPYMKGILAALLVRCVAKKGNEIAQSLCERMAIDSENFDWATEIIEKHINEPMIKKVLARHAYTYTIFATLMQLSRTAENPGVFASAQFKWVRTMDRRLWYTLNNVGRYSFHVECAGIMAHWLTEKAVGMRIETPCVDRAVTFSREVVKNKVKTMELAGGLESALKDFTSADNLDDIFD